MGNYKKIDKDDILYIKNTIQDDERVLVGENINEEYSHDELSGTSSYPDVVVKAKSAEEIAAIMKYAYENTIPVTPRQNLLLHILYHIYNTLMLKMHCFFAIKVLDFGYNNY